MLIIFSKNNDRSTSLVARWLIRYKISFIRFNKGDHFDKVEVKITDQETQVSLDGQKQFNLKEVKGFWFRRGGLFFKGQELPEFPETVSLEKEIEIIQKQELKILYKFIYGQLDKVKSIGSYFTAGVNKLEVLKLAQEVGLKIPETLITTQRAELLKFHKKHKQIITKAIHEVPILYGIENNFLLYFTGLVEQELITRLPEVFFPSLFQKCVDKKYELRVFYLNGQCKTMVIFSQQDPQTKIDFRHYNKEYPNRKTPFKLPVKVEFKIKQLMDKIPLNCGSIDMILTKDLEFVFLEVNPVGQFGMTSYPNNFYIERDIAQYFHA